MKGFKIVLHPLLYQIMKKELLLLLAAAVLIIAASVYIAIRELRKK